MMNERERERDVYDGTKVFSTPKITLQALQLAKGILFYQLSTVT